MRTSGFILVQRAPEANARQTYNGSVMGDPAEQTSCTPQLLDFFKALAHPLRLRIAGRLAEGATSLPVLASELGIPVRDCMRHMSLLTELGLVREQSGSSPVEYRLEDQ